MQTQDSMPFAKWTREDSMDALTSRKRTDNLCKLLLAAILTLALTMPLYACGGSGGGGGGAAGGSGPVGEPGKGESGADPGDGRDKDGDDYPETLDREMDAGTRGNTCGNLANRSTNAFIGDSCLLSVYRLYPDNTQYRYIEEQPFFLNVSDGWVYYLRNTSETKTIWKTALDGSATMEVFTSEPFMASLWLHGEWLYYSHYSNGVSGVSRVKTDGTGNSLVVGGATYDTPGILNASTLVVGQDALYFMGSRAMLCKADLDGSNIRQLGGKAISSDPGSLMLHNEWVYFVEEGTSAETSQKLYRMKTDGTELTEVLGDAPFMFDFHGNELWYIAMDKDGMIGSLYAISDDGSGEARWVFGDEGYAISMFSVLGDEIYVVYGNYYILRPDGSVSRWRYFVGDWQWG